MTPSDLQECRRCGTCCRRGGPALHRQDRELVQRGAIPAGDLYTLRKGQLAWDPIRRALLPLREEIVKVKSRATARACRFLVSEDSRCSIYTDRPAECRVLTCWDVGDIEAFYERDRLTRGDLLRDIRELWELIQTHERHCSVALLGKWAGKWHAGERRESVGRLTEIIRFDNRLRQTVMEGGVDANLLDFLFGCPLTEWFEDQFGIRISGSAAKGPFPDGR